MHQLPRFASLSYFILVLYFLCLWMASNRNIKYQKDRFLAFCTVWFRNKLLHEP